MEIISFVQDTPRRKTLRIPVVQKSNYASHRMNQQKKREKSVVFSPTTYSAINKKFVAQKINNPFTVRTFFYAIGHAVSRSQKFLRKNAKKVALYLLIGAVICSGSIFVFRLSAYQKNHTGPLKMQTGETSDIEYLNQLMAAFALENANDYDESGCISDVEIVKNNYKQPVTYQTYKVQSGDTISGIARKFGLSNISTLISVNDIGNVRQLAAGQRLKIPSYDGIIYTIKKGDTLDSVIKNYGIQFKTLLDVNELSSDVLIPGQQLFLPGASLDQKTLKTAMGDRFIMPIQSKFRWTSPYGKRIDPIANVQSFHTGTDMACPTGTPIVAAMSGKVLTTGENRVYGLYVVIDHGNGYQTLYAHMSKIIATKGQWVSQGTRIGLVGSTGYSTGPHLHFTVYKNGKMIDPMTILK